MRLPWHKKRSRWQILHSGREGDLLLHDGRDHGQVKWVCSALGFISMQDHRVKQGVNIDLTVKDVVHWNPHFERIYSYRSPWPCWSKWAFISILQILFLWTLNDPNWCSFVSARMLQHHQYPWTTLNSQLVT